MDMRKKCTVPFSEKFPNADPSALKLLQRLLAFDPKDRPSAEEALADPYFKGLSKIEREPSCQPISKLEFEFERHKLTKEDIRELIFREILEYHPQLLKDYMARNGSTSFLYPSAIGQFKKQFDYLEENAGKSGPVILPQRKHVSLPRSSVNSSTIPPKTHLNVAESDNQKVKSEASVGSRVPNAPSETALRVSRPPPRIPNARAGRAVGPVLPYENDVEKAILVPPQSNSPSPHCLFRTSMGKKQENCKEEVNPEIEYASKPANAMNAERNSNPYLQLSREGSIDAKLLQAQSQFVTAAVAVASHRDVGAMQLGLT